MCQCHCSECVVICPALLLFTVVTWEIKMVKISIDSEQGPQSYVTLRVTDAVSFCKVLRT